MRLFSPHPNVYGFIVSDSFTNPPPSRRCKGAVPHLRRNCKGAAAACGRKSSGRNGGGYHEDVVQVEEGRQLR